MPARRLLLVVGSRLGSSRASTTGATSSRGRRSSRSTSTRGTSAAIYPVAVGIQADARETLAALLDALARGAGSAGRRGLAGGSPGAPRPAPGAAPRRGLPRRGAGQAAAGLRGAPAGAPAGHDRHARRGRRPRLRLRPAQLRPSAHLSHPARPGRPGLRLPGGARRQARPPGGAGARDPRRRRLPHERAGARDGGAARHRRRDAGDEQQLLGLGEGVPAALLPGALRRHGHRQSALRPVRRAVRRPGLLRRAAGSDRRRGSRGARRGQPAIVEIPIDPDEFPVPATAARRRDG